MKRRKWDPHPKSMIVIEGLKGKPVAGSTRMGFVARTI
jgi:hypothetical protein